MPLMDLFINSFIPEKLQRSCRLTAVAQECAMAAAAVFISRALKICYSMEKVVLEQQWWMEKISIPTDM